MMDGAAAANDSTVSSIGFGRTLTEAFIDLRNEQLVLSIRTKEIAKLYGELKDKDAEDLEVSTAMQDYCEGREALGEQSVERGHCYYTRYKYKYKVKYKYKKNGIKV